MIGNRMESVVSKYWQAVEGLTEDDLDFAAQQISVCALEANFIEKLMEAETAERELGEGEFFEFSGGDNAEMKKIERDVNKLRFELQSVLSDIRKLRRPLSQTQTLPPYPQSPPKQSKPPNPTP